MEKIHVTGMGIISPIGLSKKENLDALREGKCGIGTSVYLDSKYAGLLPLGETRISTTELKKKLGSAKKGLTRNSLLALWAFNEAAEDSGLSREQLSSPRTAFITANTVGGMCLTDEMYRDANSNEGGSEYLGSYDFASVGVFIAEHHQMQGIVNTINTACSSSANAIWVGARLIRNGFADRAIVGGSDSLAKFTVNGFNSLNILSTEICRPFDANRQGLNLGEGAAFLVLEKESAGAKKAYATLSGACNSNDAHHPSSLSPEGDGPFLAMKGAIENATIEPGQIDFINAHGTGTENNDLSESTAMKKLFREVPFFASTKSYTGHTLGAAGAIEAVYSIFNIFYGELYPNLHFSDPIPTTRLNPLTALKKQEVKHVLSNSFGFGGNCTSLVFSKI